LLSDYQLWNSFYGYADLFFRTGFRGSNTVVDGCVLAIFARIWRPLFELRQLFVISPFSRFLAGFGEIEKQMNVLGAEGWDLVKVSEVLTGNPVFTVTIIATFKRAGGG
jgi:hypothetical protein